MVEPQCRYNYKSPNLASQVGYLLFLSRSIIIDECLIHWSTYDLDSHRNTQSKKNHKKLDYRWIGVDILFGILQDSIIIELIDQKWGTERIGTLKTTDERQIQPVHPANGQGISIPSKINPPTTTWTHISLGLLQIWSITIMKLLIHYYIPISTCQNNQQW